MDNLVSVNWLHNNLNVKNILILDATLKKATDKNTAVSLKKQLKNAHFFDIKTTFSEQNAPFPNTMLPSEMFQEKAQKLGINNDTAIVVYDDLGIYSSARVWWMFKSMGHTNIAVLNGGLPAWIKAGFEVENPSKRKEIIKKGDFKAHFNPSFFVDKNRVLKAISDDRIQILDARSFDRFYAKVPEPREGLRSGHIPSSKNVPYSSLLDEGFLKSSVEIKDKFTNLVTEKEQLIFSCGSGVTACVLALAATLVGYKNLAVYDGSWTEWGSLHDLPIEK